uniref:Uncharacterized protein n=1 Tax=Rhizophora mucronata TaxID=61149 RepID=A0A2P2JBF6_RHIMU
MTVRFQRYPSTLIIGRQVFSFHPYLTYCILMDQEDLLKPRKRKSMLQCRLYMLRGDLKRGNKKQPKGTILIKNWCLHI